MSTTAATTAPAEKGPHGENLKACDRCEKASFPNELIYFEKLGEDPATGKIKWKLHNKDGSEHQHKGQQRGGGYRRPPRVCGIVETCSAKEADALVKGNKKLDLFGIVPSLSGAQPVVYVIVERETVN